MPEPAQTCIRFYWEFYQEVAEQLKPAGRLPGIAARTPVGVGDELQARHGPTAPED